VSSYRNGRLKIEFCALHWGWGIWVGPQSSAVHPRRKAQLSKKKIFKSKNYLFQEKDSILLAQKAKYIYIYIYEYAR
jgi:hypothetical protein